MTGQTTCLVLTGDGVYRDADTGSQHHALNLRMHALQAGYHWQTSLSIYNATELPSSGTTTFAPAKTGNPRLQCSTSSRTPSLTCCCPVLDSAAGTGWQPMAPCMIHVGSWAFD